MNRLLCDHCDSGAGLRDCTTLSETFDLKHATPAPRFCADHGYACVLCLGGSCVDCHAKAYGGGYRLKCCDAVKDKYVCGRCMFTCVHCRKRLCSEHREHMYGPWCPRPNECRWCNIGWPTHMGVCRACETADPGRRWHPDGDFLPEEM